MKIGNFDYSQDESGNWIAKAEIPRLKTKPQYKDAPRYPMIYDYEGEFKENYKSNLKDMVKQIDKQIKHELGL